MLYVDVDALCKLAHWNVLDLLPDLTGHSWNEMATVSSLRFRASRSADNPDKRLFHSTSAAAKVCACMDRMAPLPLPRTTTVSVFADEPKIDPGEAVLLALTIDHPGGRFLTGDKKALRALAHLPCATSMAGRILIIEQIIRRCLSTKGREWLIENLCPFKHIDTAISNIMGSHCDGSAQSITDGIESYVEEIKNLTSPTLLSPDI